MTSGDGAISGVIDWRDSPKAGVGERRRPVSGNAQSSSNCVGNEWEEEFDKFFGVSSKSKEESENRLPAQNDLDETPPLLRYRKRKTPVPLALPPPAPEPSCSSPPAVVASDAPCTSSSTAEECIGVLKSLVEGSHALVPSSRRRRQFKEAIVRSQSQEAVENAPLGSTGQENVESPFDVDELPEGSSQHPMSSTFLKTPTTANRRPRFGGINGDDEPSPILPSDGARKRKRCEDGLETTKIVETPTVVVCEKVSVGVIAGASSSTPIRCAAINEQCTVKKARRKLVKGDDGYDSMEDDDELAILLSNKESLMDAADLKKLHDGELGESSRAKVPLLVAPAPSQRFPVNPCQCTIRIRSPPRGRLVRAAKISNGGRTSSQTDTQPSQSGGTQQLKTTPLRRWRTVESVEKRDVKVGGWAQRFNGVTNASEAAASGARQIADAELGAKGSSEVSAPGMTGTSADDQLPTLPPGCKYTSAPQPAPSSSSARRDERVAEDPDDSMYADVDLAGVDVDALLPF